MSSRSTLRELRNIVRREPIRSLTIDVFDTLILRDFSSEEERFLLVAERWATPLRASISERITGHEIYSFREYTRALAHRNFVWRRATGLAPAPASEFEIRLSDWIDDILDQLLEKYRVTLSGEARASLAHHLADMEIAFETERLRPNRKLIAVLDELHRDRRVRIYLVSDMYLSGSQLAEILSRVGVSTYDGLVTSSDLGVSKKSGRLFDLIEANKALPHFSNAVNVHVGDRIHADLLAPRLSGSRALLLRTGHHVRQRVGYRFSRRVTLMRVARHHRKEAVRWKARRARLDEVSSRGALFGPSALEFATVFVDRARRNPGIPFVAVSSEASFFEQVVEQTSTIPPSNVHYLPGVNRLSLLHSIESVPAHQREQQTDRDFRLLDEVRSQVEAVVHEESGPLKPLWPFDKVVPDQATHLTLLDVGWMGTIQVMTRHLAEILGRRIEISGLYLGRYASSSRFEVPTGFREGVVFDDVNSSAQRPYFVPELWEFILGNKPTYADQGPHAQLQTGIFWAVSDWRENVRLAPDEFSSVSLRPLKKMLLTPRRADRAILGSILWDVRVGPDMERRALVPEPPRPFLAAYAKLFLHPRLSYREYVTPLPHIWVAGFARAQGLGWFMRLALFVAKLVGHPKTRRF